MENINQRTSKQYLASLKKDPFPSFFLLLSIWEQF